MTVHDEHRHRHINTVFAGLVRLVPTMTSLGMGNKNPPANGRAIRPYARLRSRASAGAKKSNSSATGLASAPGWWAAAATSS
jgi:hypothetical protein